jgi:tripartite-type tricarboxylate transporter receptor subunit TctC
MRHRFLPAAVAAVAAIVAILAPRNDAQAQTYPDRSVRIIIAFAAGGPSTRSGGSWRRSSARLGANRCS